MSELCNNNIKNKLDLITLNLNKTNHRVDNYINSSVMALLIITNQKTELLFTQRALTLNKQPGEVCFPGGKQENNETPLETALRETQEEININYKNIKLIGQLDHFITPFGAFITPFIGYIENINLENIEYNHMEVEKIFTVPIDFFIKTTPKKGVITFKPHFSDNFPFEMINSGKNYKWSYPEYEQYFYNYKSNIIWGVTARITRYICSILKDFD